ncbi:class I SAM-dependent methyltransferase [Patescibacteria group bacterium]|nr:class I SAM-dependent methyltransferase [Patescibacteria group bacterium]
MHRKNIRVHPLLKFYLDLSKTNHLHFGYWNEEDALTLENCQRAQERYTDYLIKFIPDGVKNVLDVGCGVGGNALKLQAHNYNVTGICPDPYQGELFKKNTKDQIPFFLTTLKDFETKQQFDLILMSESVQYVPCESSLRKISQLLRKDGYLLALDYFKKDNAKDLPKPSFLPLFSYYLEAAQKLGFKIIKRVDITKNILPTLDYGNEVFYNYIKPVLNCILTVLQVHVRPLYWLLTLFLKIRIKGKTIRQSIKNDIVPLKRETFERYLFYQVILMQKEREI